MIERDIWSRERKKVWMSAREMTTYPAHWQADWHSAFKLGLTLELKADLKLEVMV